MHEGPTPRATHRLMEVPQALRYAIPNLTFFIGEVLIHEPHEHVKLGESLKGGPLSGERSYDQVDAMVAMRYTILNGIPPFRTGTEPTMRYHHGVFEHFKPSKVKHGKGNLINCIAQTLVRTDNVIIVPTKVHFGVWISIDQNQVIVANSSESYLAVIGEAY